jgi:hypothetical protein
MVPPFWAEDEDDEPPPLGFELSSPQAATPSARAPAVATAASLDRFTG